MARRHRGIIGRGVASQRRSTVWIAISPTSTVLAAAGNLIGVLNAAADALRPFTIVRTHLAVQITSDQAIATEIYGVGIGIAVVSDQASAIGITAMPTPITDLGSDLFFLHQLMWGSFFFASAVGVDASNGRIHQIDSKAMRKVTEDEDVVITLDTASATVGSGAQVEVMGRMLLKLH